MKVFKRSVWTLASIFFLVLFIAFMVAQPAMMQNEGWINSYFGINPYEVQIDKNDTSDTEYFKSKYVVKDENGNPTYVTDENGYRHQAADNDALRANSLAVSNRAATEGAVLLWNKDVDGKPALPLDDGASVGIFGTSVLPAVRRDDGYFYQGGGSGRVYKTFTESVKDAFADEGFKVNEKLYNAYADIKASNDTYYTWKWIRGIRDENGNELYGDDGLRVDYNYCEALWHEIPWGELEKKIEPSVDLVGNTAVMVVSRYGGENGDTNWYVEDALDNNYLDLYEAEAEILTKLGELKKAGVVKKIVVLLNTGTAMAFKHIKDYDIDACMWVGYGGDTSFVAMAQLLSGKVNPSGHLADTYVYDVSSAPAAENFGDFTFTESAGVPKHENYCHNNKYVIYEEGIYVGYRYYETRYEDAVMNAGQAKSSAGVKAGSGEWSYGDEVIYPFGHGLSYTSFGYSDFDVDKKGDVYEISVTVTNKGAKEGRDVVQIYLQKPYTQYDRENKIEKSAVELVGFAKTKVLKPGEKEVVKVSVDTYEFKCYDAYGKGTYILEKGDYFLTAAENAHDAVNNILAAKGYKKTDGMDADGNAAFAEKVTVSRDDYKKYSKTPYTEYEVENRFNDTDINLYSETKDSQGITYLSRSDWKGTYPTPAVMTCTSAQMISDMQYGGKTIVNGELKVDNGGTLPKTGEITAEAGELSLAMLIGLDFDNPLWDDLLNQLTFEEQYKFITYGSSAISGAESVSAPGYVSADGPQGVKVGTQQNQVAFASVSVLASTFDEELAEEYGNTFGHEMLHQGVTGIYATGANLHRTAYGGRHWEYMSEDPVLTGKMFARQSLGFMETGAVMFTKHFLMNDQERNRYGITTWANEQSIRELYLKAFEAGVTEGKTNGIMSSFNRLGTTWAGAHYGLLTEVLRNEWGFVGIIESDSCVGKHMFDPDGLVSGILAGQDVWMASATKFGDNALDAYKENPTVRNAMREACHRNLYVMANSSAMNGISRGARIIYHMPWWQKAILAGQIVSGILMGLCVAMTVASFVLVYLKKAPAPKW